MDSLTWPTIKALMRRIEANPPTDLMVGAFLKAGQPKNLSQQISAAGLPVKKGKVKRYGDKRG